MRAEYGRVAHDLIPHLFDQHGIGGFAENRVEHVADQPDAAVKDKQRHRHADRAVQPCADVGDKADRQKHRRTGNNVVPAVGGGCSQRAGVDLLADLPIKNGQPQLDGDRADQHGDRHGREGNRRRRDQLSDAAAEQLDADGQDQHRHREPGEVFIPRVSERMIRIGRTRRHPEAEQADDAGCRVGQVIHRVRRDGNAAAERADRKLCGKEQKVADDADCAGKAAVGVADVRRCKIVPVLDEYAA